MKITIKLSETNNALLNRVLKEEKVDASEFANNAFLDKFLPVSEKLGIEAGFILQEHEAGTLNAGSSNRASPVESVGWESTLSVTTPF